MTRTPLPYRRQNVTREIVWDKRTYTVCVGFDPFGDPREVFADGEKDGSAMQAFIDDACIIISIALQYGVTRDALAHSLGKVPRWHDGKEAESHASPIGAILEAIEPRPEIAGVRA